MLRAGLTGNYGSGKSAVLDVFGKLGALTIDADKIVDGLLDEKPVLEKLRTLFGDEVFGSGGGLLREKAAEIIFADSALRRKLEDVLHPLVFERIEEALKNEDAAIAVIEAALIFERGYEGRFDRIITVYTDDETVLGRLEKAGIKRDDALMRLSSQMAAGEKAKRADYAIDNGGTPEETERQVREIYEKLKRLLEIR